MTSSTPVRRQVQRFGLAGIGSAVLFVSIAGPAAAATDVVIPLQPSEVVLSALPVENFGAMDPMTMADPSAGGVFTPVEVQYSGTLEVEVPADLDDTAAEVELSFDDDGDGSYDVTYSSALLPADPFFLAVTGQGTGTLSVTLPADDGAGVDDATLFVEPLTDTLGTALEYYDPVAYELTFDAAAPATVTVTPELLAFSQVPCDVTSGVRCPFPTPVTAGSTVTLDLTAASPLRELGLPDLTGVEVGLVDLDANGDPTGAAAPLATQVAGSRATFVLPAGTAAGQYGVVVAQQAPSGAVSVVLVEVTVVAADTPAVVPPAAPTTQAVTGNAGLRSNTGVTAPAAEGATGFAAAGAGLLVLAGAGGLALARTRRRPAVEDGTDQA
ncbi:hypothetical protein ACWKWC_20545 [Geodermatophilus nigrescens]